MNWDYLLFAALLVFACRRQDLARRRLLRLAIQSAGGEPQAGGKWFGCLTALTVAALVGLLAGGWWLADYWEQRSRLFWRENVSGVGLIMARDLERMGHADIPSAAGADDAKILAITASVAEWLGFDPRIGSIYTFRKTPDGATAFVIGSGSSPDRGGRAAGESGERARYGAAYVKNTSAIEEAFQNRPVFPTSPVGGQLYFFTPLHDLSGHVEAVLGVGFHAAGWQRTVFLARIAALGSILLLAFLLNFLFGLIFRRRIAAIFAPGQPENAAFFGDDGFRDIIAYHQLEAILGRQMELEKLLAAVSAQLASIRPAGLDEAIRAALADVGRFTGADRAWLFLFFADETEERRIYSWNATGANLPDETLDTAAEPWLMGKLASEGRVYIPKVDDMPAGAEREVLSATGIKSLVAVPLSSGERLVGALGLHSRMQGRNWQKEDLALPQMVGEVVLAAIQRCQVETALTKSEAENEAIIASVPDILYHMNADGVILDSSPSARRGDCTPLPVGGSIVHILPIHLVKPALDTIAKALASGETQVFEYYLKVDSAIHYFEARFTKTGSHDVLAIVRDITDRRRSEACDLLLLDIAVKVLEEQPLDDILAFACRHIMAIYGLDLLWVGRKKADGSVTMFAAGDEARDCVAFANPDKNHSTVPPGLTTAAIDTGRFQKADIDDPRITHWRGRLAKYGASAGASFPLKISGLILGALTVYASDESFWTKRTIVHFTNFAEQIALAIHATTSRQRLKLLTTGLESAVNAVVIADRTGAIQWVNPAFLNLTGYTATAVLAENIRGIFAVVDAQNHRNPWPRILTGNSWQGEITGRHKDGGVFIGELTVAPVRDENGEIANFITIVHDVTQRRQAEQDMIEAREAVVRAERLSSLGIMTAGIAHEINQPLNSLKVTADGMLYWHKQGKTPAIAKIMENVEKISKQADRIDNIIKHMRFFVRSSQGGQPEPCDINTAVVDALSLVGAQLDAHAIAVRPQLTPHLPPVLANNTQMEEVIINLIVNAMQALDTVERPGKTISIVTGCQNAEVFLEISDNGPGISSKIRGKIFEPFFTTKPAGEGMGLGLSIVHSIIAAFGGRIITKDTRKTRGAAFRIAFPAGVLEEKGEKRA